MEIISKRLHIHFVPVAMVVIAVLMITALAVNSSTNLKAVSTSLTTKVSPTKQGTDGDRLFPGQGVNRFGRDASEYLSQ